MGINGLRQVRVPAPFSVGGDPGAHLWFLQVPEPAATTAFVTSLALRQDVRLCLAVGLVIIWVHHCCRFAFTLLKARMFAFVQHA
jgi:hypothetical protein